jgi:DNA-binding NarL/FixJ family response regulator
MHGQRIASHLAMMATIARMVIANECSSDNMSKESLMANLRILIVDDEKAVRSALERLLGTRGEWEVVGQAVDGREAIGKAKELKPDVVIMDVTMPQMSGLEATPEIKKVVPTAEVLIFTQHDSTQIVQQAQKVGASGYLLKSQANWLVAAVEAMGQHKPFFQGRNLPKTS